MNSQKIGVIDVGGGMRGIYAAGVLDYCLDHQIHFDLGIGISAGSANLASYFAGQPRRNLQFYSEYALRKEYMGVGNFLRKRSFIALDYVYGTLSNSDGENPIDFDALYWNPAEFYILATDAETGRGRYFEKDSITRNHYDFLKASSAIPFVCRPYLIGGIPYYDGALADPVPVQKAFDLGCDKVILILTLPEDTIRTNKKTENWLPGSASNILWRPGKWSCEPNITTRALHWPGHMPSRICCSSWLLTTHVESTH